MRETVLILVTAAVAGCGGPQSLQQAGTAPFGTNRLADTLAGRTAGSPVACLPAASRNWQGQSVEGAIAFRRGSQLYVSTFEGPGCDRYGRPGYALVTQDRGPGMCRGDIAWILDTSTGARVGSCVLGPFVPYSAVRKWQ